MFDVSMFEVNTLHAFYSKILFQQTYMVAYEHNIFFYLDKCTFMQETKKEILIFSHKHIKMACIISIDVLNLNKTIGK